MRPKDPFIGRSILNGQFQIVQKIGTGGMGSVYKASQPEMNRMVAIKILHPKLIGRKDLTSRFRREARAMSQLTHPNTTKVFMYGQLPEDGSLYIVMEYLEGKNLNQTVRRGGPLAVERAIPILSAVCEALDEAHQMGIVHRDLKPENIFLCRQGALTDFPKVLDFGLAKVTERQMRPGSLILTQEGMVFGTPEFMSPEQAQGQTLDPRSDIYSLAVILYEVLTGKLPFVARTPMEYIQKHVTERPIPLNDRVEGKQFPVALQQVIEKALAKKAEARYQSAAEFATALRHAVTLDGESPQPGSVGSSAASARAVESGALPSQPIQSSEAGPPSRPVGPGAGVLVAVAALFLLLGAMLAMVIMRLFIQ